MSHLLNYRVVKQKKIYTIVSLYMLFFCDMIYNSFMKKLFIFLVIFNLAYSQTYKGEITDFELVRVRDGDTFVINIKGIPEVFEKEIAIRIRGIDTPEKNDEREEIPLNTPVKIELTVNADSMETNCSLKYNGREYLLAKYKEFDNPYLWYDTSKKQYDAYQKARKEFNASKYD